MMPETTDPCFFDRKVEASFPRGRILLLTYHFPPGRAAGVLRWQKFAALAAERGYGVDAFCLHPNSLEQIEAARLDDLPDGTRAFGIDERPSAMDRLEDRAHGLFVRLKGLTGGRGTGHSSAASDDASTPDPVSSRQAAPALKVPARPTSFARTDVRFDPAELRSWLRAYWGLAEYVRHGDWAFRAGDLAHRVFDAHRHRFIVTCGPPHRVHDAGRVLAGKTGLPWIMDLRDPWSRGERIPEVLASPLTYALARRSERKCLAKARLVVMNTEPAREDMAAAYPARAKDVVAVPNAVDEESIPNVPRDPRFLIAYAGTVYLDRTPEVLFRAAARVAEDLELDPSRFGIEFMGSLGSLDGTTIDELADRAGLAGFVKMHPPSDYQVAQRFLATASMLVSLPQDSHLAIPSKIFDYMRFEARLLALAEPDSATERLLRGTSAEVVEPLDEEGLVRALTRAVLDWRVGKAVEPLATDPRFSRRTRAAELFDAIEARLEPWGA